MARLSALYDYLHEHLRARTREARLLVCTVSMAIYAVVFSVGYPVLGRTSGTLSVVPILVAAHFFGVAGGVIAALASFAVTSAALAVTGYADLFSFARIVVAIISVLFGLASGVIRQVTVRGRRSGELLDIAFGAAHDGLWDYRLSTGEVYFSPRWFTMLGYEPDQFEHRFDTWKSLIHPEDRDQALATIDRVIKERREEYSLSFRMRHADGSHRWILARGRIIEKNRDGTPERLVGVHADITKLKEAEHEIAHLAHYDQLTGLRNRSAFYEHLRRVVDEADRSGSSSAAVLLVDLDNFKDVNDSYGHDVGDELLRQVAARLSERVRKTDALFRLGGDEFTLLLSGVQRPTDPGLVANDLIRSFSDPFVVERHTIYSSLSVGIAVFPNDGDDPAELVRRADTALNRAKLERNRYRFYAHEMQEEAVRKMQIVNDLRRALEGEEFELYYQPIVRADGTICGVEALLRWNDPEHGMRPPADFIPIAEETGLILRIGRWVLVQATSDAQRWRQEGLGDIPVSVNVAPRQIRHHTMMDDIDFALAASGLPADLLSIELTEGSFVDPTDESTDRLHELQRRGVSISIDDFGTGYSSMSYLKRLPVDTLKIDRSFVIGLPEDEEDVSIVQAIITMAHGLGLRIVAEGVDSDDQVGFLRERGCDCYQGYLYSRPVPAPAFESLVSSGTARRGIWEGVGS